MSSVKKKKKSTENHSEESMWEMWELYSNSLVFSIFPFPFTVWKFLGSLNVKPVKPKLKKYKYIFLIY